MKRFLTALLFSLAASTALAGDLVILSDYWCPYACLPGNQPGYMVEVVKAIFEPRGIKVSYKPMAWEDAIRLASVGEEDALIGCAKAETPNLIFPKSPFGYSSNEFFVKAGSSWSYSGVASLESVKLGISFGYDYGDMINHYVLENPEKIVTASSREPAKENLRNLVLGVVDVYIGDPYVILWTARAMGLAGKIQPAGKVGEPDAVYIGFNPLVPESAQRAAIFDEGLAALRASGVLANILSKYDLSDWDSGAKGP
jgi:polar amino acid transport system substrate-binding protein